MIPYLLRQLAFCATVLAVLLAIAVPAQALEAVEVASDAPAIDLSASAEQLQSSGNGIRVTAAPDANGVISRIEVRSTSENSSGNWLVFALANNSDEQIDRLIVAPHFRLAGSGFFWPDLGSNRILSITPSQGFALDRQDARDADVFRITLDPGTVVTFVAEMVGGDVPQLTLWEPEAYKDTINSYTLYEGIVLGIAGLLAVFLTILFVVKGSAMFPATAALAWAIMGYICVDFGFIGKIVALAPGDLNIWRAGSEVFLATSLVIFFYAYLHLNRWNTRYNYLVLTWLIGMLVLFGIAVIAPYYAAGIARVSIAVAAIFGLGIIFVLSIRGFDRAILLIPSWCLIVAWVVFGWMTITGKLDNDIVQPALGGGLVLIIMLISFTVMQHAFAGGTLIQGLVSDIERQALALTGSGDAVWDWDVDRDEVFTGAEATKQLGLKPSALNGSPNKWFELLHPDDKDRFKSTLDIILQHRKGRIFQNFRLRAENGQFHWMTIRARPVIGNDGEVLRCVGTISDITTQKAAQERMLHDAVHDNLTGLPNRQLFFDRLSSAISLAQSQPGLKPSVFVIDFDRFTQINETLGNSVGDSVLLTMARRLGRLLKPQDCLARLNGDQFVLLLLSESDPERIASLADALQRSVKAPVNFSNQEIFLTASIGLVSWSVELTDPKDMVQNAEIAMYQAKRVGGDRIEPFRPAFRNQPMPTVQIEQDLSHAVERGEMELYYQPIIDLQNKSVAGFEALLRWNHPKRGKVAPGEFIPIAERNGQIIKIGSFVLSEAARQLSEWQDQLGDVPIFVSVNMSSKQLLRHDLINDVKGALTRNNLLPHTLKLELTESQIMENPEHSSQVLSRIKDLGAGLSLDDFGTGHSSLSYLMKFPFDTIKIDRSFVGDSGGQGRPIILRSIVNLAHDLKMAVVAEGAESETDALELHQLGCEYAQGFLYGEPMTSDMALRALLQDHAPR
ncbi:MAG: EAL domain-containing protein [Rhizobiaceae bacterium]